MVESTKAIVINTIKYGDTSLIVTCYTEIRGIKTYMLKGVLKSKKSKIKAAYFQPLTILNLIASHNSKGNLNTLKEVEVAYFYNSLYTNIKKQAITLFLAEILYFSLKEEEKNSILFQYLETAFMWLDTHEDVANFHLLFLLNLTKFLGFYPKLVNESYLYFDLMEGAFTNKKTNTTISGEKLNQFKKILGINFDVIHKVNFSASNRQEVLMILIQYFQLHLEGFKKPKSLNVLKSIFS